MIASASGIRSSDPQGLHNTPGSLSRPFPYAVDDHLWLSTADLCRHLAISRSTLFALRRSGLLKAGRHVVAKNPSAQRSHCLWHLQRCELALGRRP